MPYDDSYEAHEAPPHAYEKPPWWLVRMRELADCPVCDKRPPSVLQIGLRGRHD